MNVIQRNNTNCRPLNNFFTGLDADTAYTKNDFKHLNGDKDLWRQVKLSKSMLGYCTPLALETNGELNTLLIVLGI